MTLDKLQREHEEWAMYNFGARVPELALIGMVEELGELEEAIQEFNEGKIYDSIGDVIIYTTDFCNGLGINLCELWEERRRSSTQPSLQVWIGRLSHSFLKMKQNIRGDTKTHLIDIKINITFILWNLDRIAKCNFGLYANEIAWNVWKEVKKRDWKKFPENGLFS